MFRGTLLMTAAICGLWIQAAKAADCGCPAAGCDGSGCCAQCGCGETTCKLECTKKKVTVTCYGCKCEDFCVPCPSERGCRHCEDCCECGGGGCDKCGGCDNGGACSADESKPECKFSWRDWCPGGAYQKSRKKLTKYTVEKEIPSWKWVVVPGCGCHGNGGCAGGACNSGPGCGCAKAAPAGAKPGDTFEETAAERAQLGLDPVEAQPVSYEADAAQQAAQPEAKSPLLKLPFGR